MGAIMCLGMVAFSSAANAEEDVAVDTEVSTTATMPLIPPPGSGEEYGEAKAALRAQIIALRASLEARKGEAKQSYQEGKAEFQVKKEGTRAAFQVDKAAFIASLEGMTNEEKRAAVIAYVAEMRAAVAARQSTFTENRDAKKIEVEKNKAVRQDNRVDFKASLETMTPAQKYATVLKRLKEMKDRVDAGSHNSSDADEAVETEVEVETETETTTDDTVIQ